MAAPGLDAVVALTNKATDLHHAGHSARSGEYVQRALAAAQARGAPDCLIVAKLQLEHARGVCHAVQASRAPRAPGAASPFEPVFPLFFEAAATVQRRKAAGTLLGGSCRSEEVTWERLTSLHIAEVRRRGDVATVNSASPLMGYITFLAAANFAHRVVVMDNVGMVNVTDEQLRLCIALMADAAELILQPRPAGFTIHEEGHFAEHMPVLMAQPAFLMSQGAVGARLLDSWKRLEQSGVLQQRLVVLTMLSSRERSDAVAAAAAAAAAAPGLRSCALASCAAREQHPSHFKSCAACRGPAYCSKEHQTEDWPAHKAACKAARKAAAKNKEEQVH